MHGSDDDVMSQMERQIERKRQGEKDGEEATKRERQA